MKLSRFGLLPLKTALVAFASSAAITALPTALAAAGDGPMRKTDMLMGQTLESFLSDIVSFGDMTNPQKQDVLRMSDGADDAGGHLLRYFVSDDAKAELRAYLLSEVDGGTLEAETAEVIAATLSLGGLYDEGAMAAAAAAMLLDGPVQAVYDTAGEGNMVRLGTSTTLVPVTTGDNLHNGIWGYATGDREYALMCHGEGLAIIDVTDPPNAFRVQLILMSGGGVWRDAATHLDVSSGKTYAYVGAQGTQGTGNQPSLYVIDLSALSGDLANPNLEDSNPIPSGTNGYTNFGEVDNTHTINVARGLLFLNSARSSPGCRVFDLTADPRNPAFLFETGVQSGFQCHDSYVAENVAGTGVDVLFSSDGGGRRERIYDITSVDASTNQVPPLIGATQSFSGIYAHSSWLSEDGRYLFAFDEINNSDCFVHDVTDLTNPVWITRFKYSEHDSGNSIVHNGEVRGNYLYVAYYQAGLRVFDISNPFVPVEVGKVETYRDPDGDGNYDFAISDQYEGAWNTYPFLPSGNILVNDIEQGLYIVRADPPYAAPDAPADVGADRDANDNVTLQWDAVTNARGYSVERSPDGGAYEVIAEHLTANAYTDSGVGAAIGFYRIKAVNGEGVGTSAVVTSLVGTPSPSKSPTGSPTAPTTSPSTSPTVPPTLPGLCSDDPATRCSVPGDCACGSAPAVVAPVGEGSGSELFGRRALLRSGGRRVQGSCADLKRNRCNGDCQWVSGNCVSNGPPPTPPPVTLQPTPVPTSKPTNSPVACECLTTAYPTNQPTPFPTPSPTPGPTAGAPCLGKGATCPPSGGSGCCSGSCVTKGQNEKCS